MPIKKHSRTKNLGIFARKRKPDSDDERPKKCVRNASSPSESTSPAPNADSESEDSDAEKATTTPRSRYTKKTTFPIRLVRWLKVSDARLAAVHTSAAPAHRGTYGNRKVGQGLSVRRLQELKKVEKERVEREKKEDTRHGLRTSHINDFFSLLVGDASADEQPTTPSPMEIDAELRVSGDESDVSVEDPEPTSNDNHSTCAAIVDVPRVSNGASSSRVTIEDADEEEDKYLSVEPCQLSPEALAEESLDPLLWDPAEDISPRSTNTSTPTERSTSNIESPAATDEPISFIFSIGNRFHHAKPPSTVEDAEFGAFEHVC
ncbi:hypothetical protein DFH09DRAFT_1310414 [Mycena vulgaris]|nr:hypothetical protein DFH09DRAFT_1310414 [Mycena vulgaris]